MATRWNFPFEIAVLKAAQNTAATMTLYLQFELHLDVNGRVGELFCSRFRQWRTVLHDGTSSGHPSKQRHWAHLLMISLMKEKEDPERLR